MLVLLWQRSPFPENPALQVHMKEPMVSMHTALLSHGLVGTHSLTSVQTANGDEGMKINRYNFTLTRKSIPCESCVADTDMGTMSIHACGINMTRTGPTLIDIYKTINKNTSIVIRLILYYDKQIHLHCIQCCKYR